MWLWKKKVDIQFRAAVCRRIVTNIPTLSLKKNYLSDLCVVSDLRCCRFELNICLFPCVNCVFCFLCYYYYNFFFIFFFVCVFVFFCVFVFLYSTDLQNTTRQNKDLTTRIPLKTGMLKWLAVPASLVTPVVLLLHDWLIGV